MRALKRGFCPRKHCTYLTNRKTNLQSELRSFLSHNRQNKTQDFKSQSFFGPQHLFDSAVRHLINVLGFNILLSKFFFAMLFPILTFCSCCYHLRSFCDRFLVLSFLVLSFLVLSFLVIVLILLRAIIASQHCIAKPYDMLNPLKHMTG